MAYEDPIASAAAKLLGGSDTPTEEPKQEVSPEQESPEEETLEATTEDVGDTTEEVGTEEEEYETSEEEEEVEGESDEVTPESTSGDDEDFFTVKVDGEEFEVNQEELIKGYQLEKNYTKKTQQLAEEKKALTELEAQLTQQRDQFQQANEAIARQQAAGVEQARAHLATIDRTTDPIGFKQAQLDVQELEKGLAMSLQQHEAIQAEKQAAEFERRKAIVAESDKFLSENLEGWKDKKAEIGPAILEYAAKSGYTEQELPNIIDGRDIIVLNKARLYDELVLNKESGMAKKKPIIRPKVKSPAPAGAKTRKARAVKEKRGQLKRSGYDQDAASLILECMQKK